MPALGHWHAHLGVRWAACPAVWQQAQGHEAVFSVGLLALARGQPEQDAITTTMDISSGGAVIPNLVSGAPCLSVDSRCVQHDTGDLALLLSLIHI